MMDTFCFLTVIIFLNMLFIMTPLVMLLNILFISLVLSCLFSILFSNWFAFMVFLIYVGGMLVMFSYFVALSPNQIIQLNKVVFSLFICLLIVMSLLNSDIKPYLYIYSSSYDLMYMSCHFYMLILLILLLLLMMVVVVKLVYSSKGPLRPFK
uniref:NADH dehydrogenase subunit 6 n=1 Tax=Whitmania laevis TaxID=307844 RepID=A0A0F6PC59_WHILA|nr:NADH dehydrogenase subunit 6 [Whitmania laevis]